jgi:hypothetical protein
MWIPHALAEVQKAKRGEMIGSLLQTLESCAVSMVYFL